MEQTVSTQVEPKRETIEQVYVCPLCLRDMEKGVRCACNKPGMIRTPEQAVQSRIEHLTESSRYRVLKFIQVLEDMEAKQNEMGPEVFADQTAPSTETDRKADHVDSVTWRENFTLIRFGISLDEYRHIDEAIGALQAVQERIDENDFKTKSMISCIEAYLQFVYETLQERRKGVIKAFNHCYPSEAINE